VVKGAQTVSFTSTAPGSASVGGATYTATATATSGLTPAITVDAVSSSVCSITGGVVSFQAVGTCTLDVNQAGNGNYNAATQVQQSFIVVKGAQTVSFTSTIPSPAWVGANYAVVAVGGASGNAVTFSIDAASTSGVCTISGNVVTFTPPVPGPSGTCIVDANQAGNGNFNAATQVQQSITVTVETGTPTGVNIRGVPNPQDAKPDSGDSIVYTFSQPMSPSSILNGFTGSSVSVYAQFTGSSTNSTQLKICQTNTCSTVVNLGTVSLGDPSGSPYLASGTTIYLTAQMTMATVGSQSVVTVALTDSGSFSTSTSTTTTLIWIPSGSATNLVGTGVSSTPVTESGAPLANF
jgi:hypothetical protein